MTGRVPVFFLQKYWQFILWFQTMLIKEMFMRSFENTEVIQNFVNWLLSIYVSIVTPIIILLLAILVMSYIISLLINTESKLHGKFNIKNLKQHLKRWKQDVKERFTKDKVVEISKNRFSKIKPYAWKCRYFVIGYVLLGLAWYFVSLEFWAINSKFKVTTQCVEWESHLLWLWSLYSLLFFLIAPIFITFCFWNKFIRNIWILIYILWILFIPLGMFLQLWCPAI